MAKKVNVTPLHDRVIVKAAAAEEKTAGGIIIPDTAKEKPKQGKVLAVGPGAKDENGKRKQPGGWTEALGQEDYKPLVTAWRKQDPHTGAIVLPSIAK